ncbi:MAG: exostosin family protein [Candidatus Peribacteraceae bacterium]|nr:exostosin family protein [Candidatus Peribacteraceae bacterium]
MRFYYELLPDVPYIPFLYPSLGVQQKDAIMFLNNAFAHLNHTFVERVDSPAEADYILLPHHYSSLASHRDYVRRQADLARQHGKKFLIFWHGDSPASAGIPHAVVFRTSLYRFSQRKNEYSMPAYAEDLLGGGTLALREKHAWQPVVGFCGWAQYKNLKNGIGTFLKNAYITLAALMGYSRLRAMRKGIWYRMQAVTLLQSSMQVQANFIIRSSYSGHKQTIRVEEGKARQEYIDTLLHSDYALAIKGDGNYSYRFYEALSLGRIPVLLDTDCVLPLEDIIDYDSFVLRINYKDLCRMDTIIADHYNSTAPDAFIAMQKKARAAFDEYLSTPAFFRHMERMLQRLL